MDTRFTTRNAVRFVAGFAFLCEIALAQQVPQLATQVGREASPWRKLGNNAVGLNLAGPASGPIDSVWYSPGGDRLFARNRTGQIFETSDLSTWALSKTP